MSHQITRTVSAARRSSAAPPCWRRSPPRQRSPSRRSAAAPRHPPGDPPPPNLITTTCGPNQTSIVKTEPAVDDQSVNFVPLPGANTQVVVPAGQSRSVKVLLTAETACRKTDARDFCYVRALADGVPMDPDGAGFQAMDSEDGTASAHAFEWVKRLGEGPHIIRIEQRVARRHDVLQGRLDVRRLAPPLAHHDPRWPAHRHRERSAFDQPSSGSWKARTSMRPPRAFDACVAHRTAASWSSASITQ